MKSWITQIAAAAFALGALASCQKDENKVTVAPSTALSLATPTATVVLLQANSTQAAITYTWNPVSFALSSGSKEPAVNYQLQVAKTADGFGYPTIIDAGTGTSKVLTVSELNTALATLNLMPGMAMPVFVRIVAVVGSDTHSFASNVLPLTATIYKVCLPPNTDSWGLVGPAGDGWPGATATDRVLSWDCDAKAYILRTALNAGPFKFRKDKDWAINLGGPTGNLTQVPMSLNGPDLMITTAGTYTVKLVIAGSGSAVTGGTLSVTP